MSYPLIGAVVGSCVGGPLGCLAGAKVGVFATVTCFVLGKIYNTTYIYTFLINLYEYLKVIIEYTKLFS